MVWFTRWDLPRRRKNLPIRIEISGPLGNAFAILGHAQNYGRQLGWSKEKINELVAKMKQGDYEHLVATFNEAFDGTVELYRDPDSVFNEDDDEEDY
jgi:hypothetical protein